MILKLIEDIEKSLENECYYAALALALTLPDICGKAEYPTTRNNKTRYKDWYDKYLGNFLSGAGRSDNPEFADISYMSGELVYSLRCQFLHSGNPNIDSDGIMEERNQIDKFALIIPSKDDRFVLGEYGGITYDENRNVKERTYSVHIPFICKLISRSAKKYYSENIDKFDFLNYTIVDKRLPDWEDVYLSTI